MDSQWPGSYSTWKQEYTHTNTNTFQVEKNHNVFEIQSEPWLKDIS